MAWLYRQNNSQYWWIGYRINGRQYLRSTRETDRAEAEKLLAQFGTIQEANRAGRKHRWGMMNFRLPNRDLERIWRLPSNTAGSYRRRNQRLPPRWSFKRGHPQFSGRRQLQAFHRAVSAEKRSAAGYFAQAARAPITRNRLSSHEQPDSRYKFRAANRAISR